MANVLAPFGFTPVRRLDGASWTANMTVRKIASNNSTAIFKGDVVKTLNTGYIDLAASTTTQIAGVFVGCKYLSSSQSRTVYSPYWPGSDAAADVEAYIIDDPLVVFLAQSWTATTGKMTLATIGNNIKITASAGTGSTITGLSQMALDADNVAGTTTFPFRVVDVPGLQVANLGATTAISPAANGYDTTSIYNVALVAFNSQDFKSLAGI